MVNIILKVSARKEDYIYVPYQKVFLLNQEGQKPLRK